MNKKRSTYESNFFEGLYKSRIGNFSISDLERNKRWFYAWIKLIKSTILLKKGKKILEFGCAIGGPSAILKDEGYIVTATDVSKYVIKNAKKIRKDINFKTLDITKPMYLKDKFEYIIGFEVLEHIDNPGMAIKNLKKRLNKGGWLIFSSPPTYKRFINTPTHINVHDEPYWIDMLQKAGFRNKNILIRKASFVPIFYKFNKYLNFAIPFNMDIPMLSSSIFYFAKNND